MLTVIVNIYINLGCQNLYFLGIKPKKTMQDATEQAN